MAKQRKLQRHPKGSPKLYLDQSEAPSEQQSAKLRKTRTMSWEFPETGCAPRCQWNGGPISEVRTLMESKDEALAMLQAEPTKYEGTAIH